MTVPFRPLLATDAVVEKLRFPLLGSPKLDGIRAVVRDRVVYSRQNKPIPNQFVQQLFREFPFYDGELIVGPSTAKDVYRQTVSGVMRVDGQPDVTFFVFDHIEHPERPYLERLEQLDDNIHRVVLVAQEIIVDAEALLAFEARQLALGYEGVMVRDPRAPYKMGRSTVNEGYLLKLKQFLDAEALVIGFEERQHNANAATIDERGYTRRSSHQANKVGRGDLGALVCRTPEGIVFNIGTGFTDPERLEIWTHQDRYLGRLAKYKYFPVGVKEAPRHPVFLGWRDWRDTECPN